MFFNHLNTVGEVKSEYRRLAKLHHPDLGGDTATMQRINAEYHAKLESLHGETNLGTDGKEHTYYYNENVEQAVMDKIIELLGLNLPGVTIELIGTWVWIHGDTRPVKEELKSAKCLWHSKRQKWYWRHNGSYSRRYSGASLDHLRQAYGSRTFDRDSESVAVAA